MSTRRPTPGKAATLTAAVVRALDGLDPAAKLAVLGLAERVIRRSQHGSDHRPDGDVEVRVGQVWVPPSPRIATREITLHTLRDVGYRTSRTTGLVPHGEFSQWVRRHGARPVP